MKVKTLKYLSITFLILCVSWSAIPMQIIGRKISKVAPGTIPLDLLPRWNAQEVYKYLGEIGEQGRELLKEMYLVYDFVYPILYGAFFFFAILYYSKRAYPVKRVVQWLSILALCMVAADFVENFSIVHLVNSYGTASSVAGYLYVFTISKWILVLVNFIVLIVLAIRAILMKRLLKKASH